jgi:phage-related protein
MAGESKPVTVKPLKFKGSSLQDLREFPETARREAGYQLDRVQHGLDPEDFKPMPDVGSGVTEIRIKDESGIYRVRCMFFIVSRRRRRGRRRPILTSPAGDMQR